MSASIEHFPRFDNAFLRELPGDPEPRNFVRQVRGAAWSKLDPAPVAAPRLLAHSREMAAELGFSDEDVASPEFARVFAGNALLPGMQPFASNYGGHQFGQWAGQLGDGRAISLGEAVAPSGRRWEQHGRQEGAPHEPGATPAAHHAEHAIGSRGTAPSRPGQPDVPPLHPSDQCRPKAILLTRD